MDFDSITTDELETLFPQMENENWEFKDAAYLVKDKRQELNNELATQASAFANTGGGFLVFGYADKSKTPQPCEALVGSEPMQDWLSKRIHQSVEYPLQAFHVHRIPITSDPSKAVFLIVFEDSLQAPHQSKVDQKYYWRIGSSSMPAPHFHLELLRNRLTRAVLEIESVENRLNLQKFHDQTHIRGSGMVSTTIVLVDLLITVINRSMQSTNIWGVHLKTLVEDSAWQASGKGKPLNGGVSERGAPQSLLPDETGFMTASLSATIQTKVRGDVREIENEAEHNKDILRELLKFRIQLRPVSQNFVGKEVLHGCGKATQDEQAMMDELIVKIDKSRNGYRIDKSLNWRTL